MCNPERPDARADYMHFSGVGPYFATPGFPVIDHEIVTVGTGERERRAEAPGQRDDAGGRLDRGDLFHVSAKTLLIKIKQRVFRGEMPHPIAADDDASTIAAIETHAGVVGFVTEEAARALPRDVASIAIE